VSGGERSLVVACVLAAEPSCPSCRRRTWKPAGPPAPGVCWLHSTSPAGMQGHSPSPGWWEAPGTGVVEGCLSQSSRREAGSSAGPKCPGAGKQKRRRMEGYSSFLTLG